MNFIKERLFYSKIIILFFGILYLIGDVISNKISIFLIPTERMILLLYFIVTIAFISFIPRIRLNYITEKEKKTPIKLHIWFAIILFLLSYIFATIEIITNFVGFFNRLHRSSLFFTSMNWTLIEIAIKSIIIFFLFYWKFLTKGQKKVALALLAFIVFFDVVMMGGRRTSVFLIITFIGSIFLEYPKKKKKFIFLVIMTIGIFFFFFGGIREILVLNKNVKDYNVIEFTASSNEFELVTQFTDHYVDYAHKNGYIYGNSLIIWPLFFIPRSIWNDKVESVGRKIGIFPNFFGEAYLNFGLFAFFYIFLFFFVLLILINRENINSLIVFCLLPEIYRTTFSEFIFTWILIYFFVMTITKVSIIYKTAIDEPKI